MSFWGSYIRIGALFLVLIFEFESVFFGLCIHIGVILNSRIHIFYKIVHVLLGFSIHLYITHVILPSVQIFIDLFISVRNYFTFVCGPSIGQWTITPKYKSDNM